MLNGFQVAIPAHGCPIATDRSSSTLFGVTVSHHSTSPTRIRFVVRIVGRAVPFRAPHRARAEMDLRAGRKDNGNILDPGHRHAVEEAVGGKIEAIELSIFRCHRHELLAAPRLNQDGRVGYVPIVPVLRHNLVMALIVPGLGVEHDDRVGIGVVALSHAD